MKNFPIKGLGNCSRAILGSAGDLIINPHILPHHDFILKNYDILSSQKLSVFDAILGGEREVKTLYGVKKVQLPRGTQNGHEVALDDLGVPFGEYKGKHRGKGSGLF